jgi:hypothetical protein
MIHHIGTDYVQLLKEYQPAQQSYIQNVNSSRIQNSKCHIEIEKRRGVPAPGARAREASVGVEENYPVGIAFRPRPPLFTLPKAEGG